MSFRIDIEKVLRQAVNKVQIYGNALDFTRALLKPAERLNDEFVTSVEEVITKNRYTSQVMSLEARLNNLFDNSQRRIYLETIPPLFVEFIYKAENTNKTFFYSSSNKKKFYAYSHDTYESLAALGINFIVYVPPDKMWQLELIKAEVDFYVLAGKNWIIKPTNEIVIIPNNPGATNGENE